MKIIAGETPGWQYIERVMLDGIDWTKACCWVDEEDGAIGVYAEIAFGNRVVRFNHHGDALPWLQFRGKVEVVRKAMEN
jgi:hypothetical protein